MPRSTDQIRNFSIVAHIDHGKSTLADRLLELTGAIAPREMQEQVLDQLELERERGITIKAQAVRLAYHARDGREYELNLIDTPGHVDFSYEVSRALAACDGALLVVDAAQGIEAQTVAHALLAMENRLALVPVINKIDLPQASPEQVRQQLSAVLGLDGAKAILASARTGAGTAEILEAVVRDIPPPRGDPQAPLKALIFDSHYDPYRGVIVYVRLVDGRLRPGTRVLMMATRKTLEVEAVGIFRPRMTPVEELSAGEVGFFTASIKNIRDSRVGDTVTEAARPVAHPLAGFRHLTPMVFAGLFPIDSDDYPRLTDALEKLNLNDAALAYERESSVALGFGFRCGFLGLLHMEIVQERLEREFDLQLLATAPTVRYRVHVRHQPEAVMVDNPDHLPPAGEVDRIEEPMVRATILVPSAYLGNMMELCQERRGSFISMEYPSLDRIVLKYDLPLAEIVHDFYDQLKSRTKGYASLDYQIVGFQESELVKLDVLVAGQKVDALSMIVHQEKAQAHGRKLVEKLKALIPRQLFEVPIQAAIGGKVISRETVPALRKDVIAKCYGGDITRKRKLLEKQREGKKRMKRVGQVEIPQEAFMAVLRLD